MAKSVSRAEYMKRWREENPEKVAIIREREKLRELLPTLSMAEIRLAMKAILECRAGNNCLPNSVPKK